MTKFQNADYLKHKQYAGADKLAARIRLHEQYSTNIVSVQVWEFDRILTAAPENAVVLEVGAGRGDLWKVNADRIPFGWQITLSDMSPGMLADCKTHLGADLAQRFAFEVADVQSMPFVDAQFDVVIANYMLYHVPDLPKGLSEIRRVLKPDGVFFAMTNGDNHMIELDRLIGQFAFADAQSFGLMNIRHAFTTQNGETALQAHFGSVKYEGFESGLRVTEVEPLLDYIASALDDPDTQMRSAHAQALALELRRQIERDGAIIITKETGLFTARGRNT
jgi:ubiquinone/menaquinone biosynthesis C-methylase UbiE